MDNIAAIIKAHHSDALRDVAMDCCAAPAPDQ